MSDYILEGKIRQATNNPLPIEDRLPILHIVKTRDIPYVEMDIEAEDKAFDVIVQMGKDYATDNDYFNIGLTYGLKQTLEKNENIDNE